MFLSPEQIKLLLEKSFASYLIVSKKKRGKLARKKFGNDLELLWVDFLDHMERIFIDQHHARVVIVIYIYMITILGKTHWSLSDRYSC